jgi:hypothetical protein
MNFISRWRHRTERDQEQLLVRLWTINSMNADDYGQLKPARLTFDAKRELKASLKYLSGPEIEKTVTEVANDHQFVVHLRKHMKYGRDER